MLELKNILKDYPAGDNTVHALKGVSLQFRESEFVAILGPSGCGKTTMLNIIGGLDQYTDGDLLINGVSTKNYADRDWDGYRNHSIGFVFQSYNLIPHQTVLQNVELALTLSGVSKHERRQRALKALEDVGLGDQAKKKPSQMSGGQMQRVAIARALVNNPDIILADEPTGALDTETSVQVMDILKDVAKDRLVIMVTHNPELADTYATRIIRMLDGVITDDSAPLTQEEKAVYHAANEERKQTSKGKKVRKPSMSLFTSFGLSFKNLISKKGRTMLTSFAGSIGIIGIALIYAVSQGMTSYINVLQEDTLSSYPLTIQATHMDMASLMAAFLENSASNQEHGKDAVYSKPLIYDMINALSSTETTKNDLQAFKAFIEEQRKDPEDKYGLKDAISGVQYSYDLKLQVYTKNVDGDIILSDTEKLLQDMLAKYMGVDFGDSDNTMMSGSMMGMMGGSSSYMQMWQELLPGDDGAPVGELVKKQYDLVDGSWPKAYNEIVLVLDKNHELDDMTLYALGLKSAADMEALMDAAINKTHIDASNKSWTYDEIYAMEFKTVLPSDCYYKVGDKYVDMRENEDMLDILYSKGINLKVVGIIRPNEDAVSSMITGSIGYTSDLTKYIIEKSRESEVVKAQLASPTVDIFTGLPFPENVDNMSDADKAEAFKTYLATLDTAEQKKEAYIKIKSVPETAMLDAMVAQAMADATAESMRAVIVQTLSEQVGMDAEEIAKYVESMSDEDVTNFYKQMVTEGVKMQYAAQVRERLSAMPAANLAAMLDAEMQEFTTEACARYYDEVLEFSENSYEDNLIEIGCLDLDKPSAIHLFAATFESKEVIEAAIAAYNSDRDELSQIKYTDYVGLMMNSITIIIDAITYVLIAFVSISLIVSSIMIGVITLISVQERTKEIGILRAIGASKKNVSTMFNVETVMIGFAAGALGVAVTYLLCIPINAILHALTGINNLSARLPIGAALLLIGISMLLTVFAGIIPSRSAAKKDPVVALRTE